MLRRQLKKLIIHGSNRKYETLNTVTLDEKRALSNLAYIQKQHPDFGIIPVLKANAYGHGEAEMAHILNGANCAFLAVDGYFEATKIRHITRHKILVLGYIKPENARLLDTHKCSFVVQDIAGLEALAALNKTVRIHLEINTGMNRLGLSENELEPYLDTLKKYPKLKLEGVMTHLADADNASSDAFTDNQVKVFDAAVQKIKDTGFNPEYIHIAQTAGSTKARSTLANSLRLGIGLYGLSPLDPSDAHFKELRGLQPVLELTSTIIKIIDLKKGDRVSYNGIFTAPHAMKIGILPLGYYEGVPRELSNKGFVTYKSQELPIVGRVCMNHTIIDVSHARCQVGNQVVVISKQPTDANSIERMSREHQLFNYSLVTKLSSSVRRTVA
jgi:alanine racemase